MCDCDLLSEARKAAADPHRNGDGWYRQYRVDRIAGTVAEIHRLCDQIGIPVDDTPLVTLASPRNKSPGGSIHVQQPLPLDRRSALRWLVRRIVSDQQPLLRRSDRWRRARHRVAKPPKATPSATTPFASSKRHFRSSHERLPRLA